MGEDGRAGLPPWDDRRELYVAGLLDKPLPLLIPALMEELARVGLTWGKDGCAVDVPPEPGTVAVDVGGGQTVHVRPDAYIDEDGHPRAEVREAPARTDMAILGAILGVLAAFEGGGERNEQRLRQDHQRYFEGREPDSGVGFTPESTGREKQLRLAWALLNDRDMTMFAGLSERERRERIIAVAKQIGVVHKALGDLTSVLGAGTVRPAVADAQRDVLAAELRDIKGWSVVRVGEHLRLPQDAHDRDKRDNQKARNAVSRGRKLLRKVSEQNNE